MESLTFVSRYLSGVETVFTRPIRNYDEGEQNEIEEINLLCPGRPLQQRNQSNVSFQKRKRVNHQVLDEKLMIQGHRYVLFNVESIIPFREKHKSIVKSRHRSRRPSEYELEKLHCQQFSEWFQKRVSRLVEEGDARVSEEIKWLALGPHTSVKKYSGYFVKGYRFHTKEHERFLKTQNSGVVVTVKGECFASPRDKRPIFGVINYYGSLNDIIELNYSGKLRVVLFKCDWVDVNRGVKKDDMGATLVNFSYLTHTGENLLDDPFVLASQVHKVFYAKDSKSKDWLVVRHVKVRDMFELGDNADQRNTSNDVIFDVPNLHRVGDDEDDELDVTLPMEEEASNEEDE
ncbi:unnamed protein product [Cuscuta epithymum]|uniref:DUF4216 domain-containing protein n=2 Tax=Cuscuta epithymum TaxID=186058 RepID=A0AAV0FJN0_9ASTE|nr:unnamed protein product [Cuscuta epithymum]